MSRSIFASCSNDLRYKRTIVEELNLIFGATVQSEVYWNETVKPALQTKFVSALTEEEVTFNNFSIN